MERVLESGAKAPESRDEGWILVTLLSLDPAMPEAKATIGLSVTCTNKSPFFCLSQFGLCFPTSATDACSILC